MSDAAIKFMEMAERAFRQRDELAKALDWIVSNPNAHHANMVAVAKDALDAVGTLPDA